jgi:hypothetical protein
MSDVDGIWQATIDSPMGTRDAELQLETNGPAISGALTEAGSTVDIEGVLDGEDVEFVATISGATGPMILTFSGQLDGDSLEGEVEFGEQGVGTWTAERPE